MSESSISSSQQRILEISSRASEKAQELLGEVLRLEEAKLGMKNPWGLKEEIVEATERIVDSLSEDIR